MNWCSRLRAARNPALENAIAEAMTINETSFFRDVRPFDLLRTELLPKLIEERRPTRRLRFWSAACATGQEAYWLAMLLLEHFPLLAGWNVRIEGTDLSGDVVERARAAAITASRSIAGCLRASSCAILTTSARTGP